MKNFKILPLVSLIFILFVSTGMDIVGDIFEAGLWIGAIIVILVIVLLVWLVRKFMG